MDERLLKHRGVPAELGRRIVFDPQTCREFLPLAMRTIRCLIAIGKYDPKENDKHSKKYQFWAKGMPWEFSGNPVHSQASIQYEEKHKDQNRENLRTDHDFALCVFGGCGRVQAGRGHGTGLVKRLAAGGAEPCRRIHLTATFRAVDRRAGGGLNRSQRDRHDAARIAG